MEKNEALVIFEKKTKSQILKDVENRLVYFIIGNLIWITAIILLIILANSNLDKLTGFVILFVNFIIASALCLLSLRCPFCDSVKGCDSWETKYFSLQKWTFKCETCNFSNNQINEIVDMLKRDIPINNETVARFNKRDL